MRISRVLAFCVAAATTLAASPVSAQDNDGGAGFGLEVGITRATIKAEGAEDFFKSRTGLMGGIWFGGNRNGTLGLMGEISYVVRKTGAGGDEAKLHYFEIPALIRINLGQTGNKNGFIVYPMFGPVMDVQLKGELSGIDIRDQLNGFDFGVIGGVGVEVARIGVEGRINWGFKRLEKSGASAFGDITDAKSRTVQVLLKLRFN
jgi:hypothetical protein